MSKADEKADLAALTEVDRLVHEPARLAVMSLLFVVEGADFIFLMNQTGLTWGNLSAHMSKLEEAGYVTIEKTFKAKRPHTMLRLTHAGREAFRIYADRMRKFFGDIPK